MKIESDELLEYLRRPKDLFFTMYKSVPLYLETEIIDFIRSKGTENKTENDKNKAGEK